MFKFSQENAHFTNAFVPSYNNEFKFSFTYLIIFASINLEKFQAKGIQICGGEGGVEAMCRLFILFKPEPFFHQKDSSWLVN